MNWLVGEVSHKLKPVKKAYSYDRRAARRPFLDRGFYLPPEVSKKPPNVDPKGTDLDIWTYERETPAGPKLLAIAFQGKQSKPLWHYSFRNESDRNSRIKQTIESRQKTLEMKKQRQEEKKNFQHGLEKGSILYSSWGYDQTNVNFYEVTDVKGKQVILRPIKQRVVKEDAYYEQVVPAPGQFNGPAIRRTPSPGYRGGASVKINSSQRASLWDGKPKQQSGPYGGH